MPDVQEVFRMATHKVRPDPEALERQFRHQRRRVAKRKIGVYAAVVGLAIAGLVIGISSQGEREQPAVQPPAEEDGSGAQVQGLPPTVERLEGIWYEDSGTGQWPQPVLARFEPDGTFSHGGALESDAFLSGTYEVEGRTITLTVTGGDCGGGDVFTYRDAAIMADGRLEAVFGGSDGDSPSMVGACEIPVGDPYNFTRISPTSPGAADVTFGSRADGPVTRETSTIDLQGYWLVEGTGQLLRLDWSGSYLLDDSGQLATNPDDAGRVEVGRRTLRFVSSGVSGECAEGDVMAWDDVRIEEGRLRGVVSEDACGHGLGEEVTLLLLNVDTP